MRTLLATLWLGFIGLVTLPWASWQTHPHWGRVVWVPFAADALRPWDIAANVAIYLPLGYLWRRGRSIRRPWGPYVGAAVSALLVSAASELAQVYSHSRFPTATDVACNVIGALAGVALSGFVEVRKDP